MLALPDAHLSPSARWILFFSFPFSHTEPKFSKCQLYAWCCSLGSWAPSAFKISRDAATRLSIITYIVGWDQWW